MISPLLLLLLTVLTWYLVKNINKPQLFPPGPKWYPLFGCSSIVQNFTRTYGSQWKGLSELAKKYSTRVLGLKLGSELLIVVYGEKNIRQVFMDSEFEGRPDSFFIRLRCLGKRMGLTFADGPLWKEHRQFTVKHLKNVGFGKTAMEAEIQNEMLKTVAFIKHQSNAPINPKNILASSVMNTLWKYAAGEKIKEDQLKLLLELLDARSKAFSMAGGWLTQAPWCRFLFPERSGYTLIARVNQQLSDIIEEAIVKHKNKLVQGNDFIYSFLDEMQTNEKSFTEEQLRIICLDLLISGSQTTSNVIEFALLTVLRNQMIQEKIYDEIYGTIGDQVPCWSDRYGLVYTSAFLLEVQRYYIIAPLAGPRRVLWDTNIDGYFVPKGSTVLISLGDLHFDPNLWENPEEFIPERFIDKNGGLKTVEHFYPFGLGRRRCPGDSLAKSFIFITFVGLLQKYKIGPSNGVLPSPEPIVGLLSSPTPYTAEFIPRK